MKVVTFYFSDAANVETKGEILRSFHNFLKRSDIEVIRVNELATNSHIYIFIYYK